jgi:hypothetical protein
MALARGVLVDCMAVMKKYSIREDVALVASQAGRRTAVDSDPVVVTEKWRLNPTNPL